MKRGQPAASTEARDEREIYVDYERDPVTGEVFVVQKVAATTPPSLTEQAQLEQRAWKIVGDLDQFNEFNVVHAMVAFAAEAATQGQSVGIERAALRCEGVRDGIASNLSPSPVDSREGGINTANFCASEIRALSPDPSYLDRVRNEALKQAVAIVRESLNGDDAISKLQERIAAIGDDREQRQ